MIQRTTGRQARARAPHHRARAEPWGSRGERGGAPRGDGRGLATDGGEHMNGTGEAERTAKGHCEIPDDGLCMSRYQGGTGNVALNLKTFRSGQTTYRYFSPPR